MTRWDRLVNNRYPKNHIKEMLKYKIHQIPQTTQQTTDSDVVSDVEFRVVTQEILVGFLFRNI